MGVTLTHFLWALNATCDLKFHFRTEVGSWLCNDSCLQEIELEN